MPVSEEPSIASIPTLPQGDTPGGSGMSQDLDITGDSGLFSESLDIGGETGVSEELGITGDAPNGDSRSFTPGVYATVLHAHGKWHNEPGSTLHIAPGRNASSSSSSSSQVTRACPKSRALAAIRA